MPYFDYAAATPLSPEVRAAMEPYLTETFANPASLHQPGQAALRALTQAREKIRLLIAATSPTEVIFTASATESNNLAFRGVALSRWQTTHQPTHIITSSIEHPSVLEPLADLERLSLATVTRVSPEPSGQVSIDEIFKAIRPETSLVSIHYVNSEIGAVQNIPALGAALAQLNRERVAPILLHSDAAQAPLTEAINISELGVDFLTLSAHKIYGPRGAALLFVRNGIELEPLLSGGEQEFGQRAGTENVPAIVGFATALEFAASRREKARVSFAALHETLLAELHRRNIPFEVNGTAAAARITNIYFSWIEAQELLIGLDQRGLAVSAGSACRARAVTPSPVVAALYPDTDRARRSIRISFGRETTEADLGELIDALDSLWARYNTI